MGGRRGGTPPPGTGITHRARRRIVESGADLAAVAGMVGMSPSQLSESLDGAREFSAVELSGVADALGVSFHWLVTGKDDPLAATAPAPPGHDDGPLLEDMALVYRQAYA